jgi:hypothetical protein
VDLLSSEDPMNCVRKKPPRVLLTELTSNGIWVLRDSRAQDTWNLGIVKKDLLADDNNNRMEMKSLFLQT